MAITSSPMSIFRRATARPKASGRDPRPKAPCDLPGKAHSAPNFPGPRQNSDPVSDAQAGTVPQRRATGDAAQSTRDPIAPPPGGRRRPAFSLQLSPSSVVTDGARRYTVLGTVGQGCFGEVYKAWDPTLDQAVALKVCSREDADTARCTEQELQRLRQLQHPHVVAYKADFVWAKDGTTYTVVVLGYCGGGTLKQRIAQQSLSVPHVLRLLLDLSAALEYLQSNAVIHGDLKCSNVLFDLLGHAIITDFGVSQLIRPGGEMYGGDLWYLPPEAAQPGSMTAQYDLWSAGIILAEVATMCLVSVAFAKFRPISKYPTAVERLLQSVQEARQGLFYPLTKQLLVFNPVERMSATDLVVAVKQLAQEVAPKPDPSPSRFLKLFRRTQERPQKL
eukprot:EG_transcript_9221